MQYPRSIYAIQHNETGRIYVGSASDVEMRYKAHIWSLRKGNHNNKLLQEDFDKYGEDFSLYVVGFIKDRDKSYLEYELMENLHTDDPRIGYNGNDPHFRGEGVTINKVQGVPTPNILVD